MCQAAGNFLPRGHLFTLKKLGSAGRQLGTHRVERLSQKGQFAAIWSQQAGVVVAGGDAAGGRFQIGQRADEVVALGEADQQCDQQNGE